MRERERILLQADFVKKKILSTDYITKIRRYLKMDKFTYSVAFVAKFPCIHVPSDIAGVFSN